MITILDREPTPNPNAFKYHTGAPLVGEGSLSFVSLEEAKALPLAEALFSFDEVDAVLLAEDFVSVSASPGADWAAIERVLTKVLGEFDVAEATGLAAERVESDRKAKESRSADELFHRVDGLIDTYVRPALAGDGGGIELVSMEDKVAFVRYQGACGSCPTSTRNTLMAIERLLQSEIDPEIRVAPV